MDGVRNLTEGGLCIKLKISGHRELIGGGSATIVINQQQQAHGGGDDVDMDVDVDEGGRHVCPVCEKIFWSEKSLFGHMRCHPDRPWRGIHPPSSYSPSSAASNPSAAADGEVIHPNSSSSTLSSHSSGFNNNPRLDIDSATTIDLAQALRGSGWSKTHTRGRKKETIVAAPSPPAPGPYRSGFGLQLEEEDAVHDLMLLARGHPNPNRILDQPENHQEATKGESSPRKRTRSPEINHHCDELDYDAEVVEEQSESKRRRFRAGDLDTVVCITEGGRIIGPNLAILPPLPPLPPPSPPYYDEVIEIAASSERFKCSICNRSFATHQALGGHVSSHNKLSRTKLAAEAAPPPPPMEGREDHSNIPGDQYDPESPPATAAQHSCRTCNKMFSTGQALGGHMRCHYSPAPPPPPPPPSSSSIAPPINCTSTGVYGSDGSGRKAALDFDLNLPAPEAEKSQESAGNGKSL